MIPLTAFARSTGYAVYNSHNFFSREKIDCRVMPGWNPVLTSMHGPIDVTRGDLVMRIPLRLWGAWENLGDIFPSYLLNPTPGTSVFGTTNKSLQIIGRNGDSLTYTQAAITELANLYLGVDSELFAADVVFTAILGNDGSGNLVTPETSGAYTTRGTATYSDTTAAFSKGNFKKVRFSNAWGAITGFTSFIGQKGISISWKVDLKPVPCDGYGTVDMSVQSMIAQAKMIPLGPSVAQMKTNSQEEAAPGTLGSTIAADLVMTGSGGAPVVTLKNAYMKENGLTFDSEAIRMGEATWETTKGFSAGVPAVTGAVA